MNFNRKGFTLIELLAVIVIMAIILVITVPNIIQSINDARVNSLHNLAVNSANSFDTAYVQNLISSDQNENLNNIIDFISVNYWKNIGDIDEWSDGKLSDILGINNMDVNLSDCNNVPVNESGELVFEDIDSDTCSSIRINDGSTEVLLVAKEGGRFYVAQKVTYAYSKDDSAKQKDA